MVLSSYSQSASRVQPKRGNHPLSDLSASIRIFQERQDRGTMSASNAQDTSKGFQAFQNCVDYCPSTASTQEDWLTNAQDDDVDDDIISDTKSTTIERMCRNIHRKRDAWQQMALRCRYAGNPHQKTLQILKEAVKRAKAAAATITEDFTSCSETSDESILAKTLLHQVRSGTPAVHVQNNKTKWMDVKTAAMKLQATYRGYIARQHTNNLKQQKAVKEIAATRNQWPPTLQQAHISISHLKRPSHVERQCSDITMSDFGDSIHQTPSAGTRLSFRNPSRWIQQGNVEESSDDDDNLDRERLTGWGRRSSWETNPRYNDECKLDTSCHVEPSGLLNSATANHTPKTSIAKGSQLKHSASFLFGCNDTPSESDCWQWQHHSWSTFPVRMNPSDGDIRITCSRGYSSYSSYFFATQSRPPNLDFVQDQQSRSPPIHRTVTVTPTTSYKTPQSGSQDMDDYIDSMLEEDEDDDNTNDDDDDDENSHAESFFEEEPLVDKDSLNILHRSDGSLDFRSTLKKKSATFRDLKGKIPPSCFHLSLSTSSRWDGGLPDPTTVSQLPQQDQVALAKAAISTYLPVRPPPRKLTPSPLLTPGTSDFNNSVSTVFSSAESTEPSPQMPLRKASTHGSAHLATKSREDEHLTKLSIPYPPLTRRSGRSSVMLTESSPKLPIRKTSAHHGIHSTQGDNPVFSVEGASPKDTGDSLSLRRTRGLTSTNAPTLEDVPIRQPERKSSSLVVDDSIVPQESSHDDVSIFTNLNSPPLPVVEDHPIRLPVRKLSALTLSSSTHDSLQTPPRPPKPSPQQVDVLSSINDSDP